MGERGQEPLVLANKVVAILGPGQASEAVRSLRHTGAQVEEITSSRDLVLPTEKPGLKGAVQKAAAAFGDELRIFEAIEDALQAGREIVVVDGGDADAAEILQEAGADTVWDFRDWTFTKAGGPAPEGPVEHETR